MQAVVMFSKNRVCHARKIAGEGGHLCSNGLYNRLNVLVGLWGTTRHERGTCTKPETCLAQARAMPAFDTHG